jgi:fatty acid desaturase
LLGIRQRAFATLLHEATHFTLARSRLLCVILGYWVGWSIFQTFGRYRQSHGADHHFELGDPQRDPDLVNYIRQGLFEEKPASFVRNHLTAAVTGRKILPNLRNLLRDRLVPQNLTELPASARVEYVGLILYWAAIIGATTWFGLIHFVVMWLCAYLLVFQTLNWLIELSEHFPIIRMSDSDLEMSRNREGHWLEDYVTGMHGEKWHLVHHLHPGISFWMLPAAHRIMLEDPDYARANAANSGIFSRGRNAAPSILIRMQHELSHYQALRPRV